MIFLVYALSGKVFAQESISGVINTYAVVKQVYNDNPANQDTITINDTTGLGLKEQDAVLIIQMKGAELQDDFVIDPNIGQIQDVKGAGLYEFILIREFLPGNRIILARNLLNDYDPNEVVQLVRVPFYDYATVTGTLTCLPWNDSTGGVLAMVIFDTLVLQANIDVSGLGFKGATPDPNTGYCGNPAFPPDYRNFIESSTRAGRKGQGIGTTSYIYTKGSDPVANGGGGDHGNYSGAGGGALYGNGGLGGWEIDSCGSTLNGLGGVCNNVFDQMFDVAIPRAFMGGGGGTTTQQNSDLAYKGGDGGGIAIIITSHIKSNGFHIRSNGESVPSGAQTGGSGGGAGGSILLAVDTVIGTVYIDAIGGNGGSVNNPGFCNGAGGGGGGGLLWHSWPTFKAQNPVYAFTGGAGGSRKTGCTEVNFTGTPGYAGARLDSLNVPLNGFLFNVMPPDQTICEGETPATIKASYPKGGDGTYTFIWEQKTKLINWGPAVSAGNTKNYSPPALIDTTYFRRIVQSGAGYEFVSDTSFTLVVNVHPLIQNNTITANQVICYGDVPKTLNGSNPTGGIGFYDKQWEQSGDNSLFTEISGATGLNFSPDALIDTVYYRRRVNSGVCEDFSNTLTITVLPSITNNTIANSQEICKFSIPDPLTGGDAGGGDLFAYKYQWESNTNGNGWDSITYTTNNAGYTPASLSDSMQYRRIVRSGLNDVCKDTSNVISIDVLPLITNNNISGGDTVCQYIPPEDFTGTQTGGGDGTYLYQWIWSADTTDWDSITSISTYDIFNPGGLMESGFFKRVALSGDNYCCKDTSKALWVMVYPAILNNNLSADQEICLGSEVDTITGGTPDGGDGMYSFAWETRTQTTNWTDIGISDSLYEPETPVGAGRYLFRRIVVSNVCINYSDSLILNVLPLIDDNIITDNQTICYNSVPDSLIGTFPAGGRDSTYNYQWLSSTDMENWTITSGYTQSYTPPALTVPMSFKRVVLSGLNDCCKDTSNIVSIDIWDLPVATLSAFNNPDTTCAGDLKVLDFTFTGPGPWSVNIYDGSDTIEASFDQANDTLHLFPNFSSVYEFISVADNNGCYATEMSGSVMVIVYDVPLPYAGPDTSVCGLTVGLVALPSVGTGIWSALDGSFDYENLPNTNYNAPENGYGEKFIIWIETNWECQRKDSIMVTFYEQPTEINAGDDINVYGKLETNLNATAPGVGVGTWSKIDGNGHIVDINDPATLVDSLVMGQNLLLLWTVDNVVCAELYDTLDIYTQPVTPPNGFSPNNDGVNDYFEIGGLDIFATNHLKIFTRWGTIILDVDNYKNDWAGTGPNNADLPEDTYFYIFTGTTIYGNVIPPIKGYFVIKR